MPRALQQEPRCQPDRSTLAAPLSSHLASGAPRAGHETLLVARRLSRPCRLRCSDLHWLRHRNGHPEGAPQPIPIPATFSAHGMQPLKVVCPSAGCRRGESGAAAGGAVLGRACWLQNRHRSLRRTAALAARQQRGPPSLLPLCSLSTPALLPLCSLSAPRSSLRSCCQVGDDRAVIRAAISPRGCSRVGSFRPPSETFADLCCVVHHL